MTSTAAGSGHSNRRPERAAPRWRGRPRGPGHAPPGRHYRARRLARKFHPDAHLRV